MGQLERATYPMNREFYIELASRSDTFPLVRSDVVPPGEGFGLRIEAAQTIRMVMMERANMLDVCIYNADDPSEFYNSGAQAAIEGGRLLPFVRVWGTPPRSRPLCTVLRDTVPQRPTRHPTFEHNSHAAHCSQHTWTVHGRSHSRTCYDNLRQGLAMLGLHQRYIHDNVNLFYKLGIDPATGHYVQEPSDAEDGDYIEFFAEIPLLVVISICPWGDGTVTPTGWGDNRGLVSPLKLEVRDSAVAPLGWPYPDDRVGQKLAADNASR